ncbi:hypothetical protein CTAYLR_008987 [Chrysophaeum taylorii]|uniref:WLM domain-containing protein n=1 Tax=Chrysophaeum taylorii TaxID=2483200 RepID=A0AAD7UPH9_9STRA|nr:hypothetical protein CTAYLR_008987 [Chrysophaeum taylorii]
MDTTTTSKIVVDESREIQVRWRSETMRFRVRTISELREAVAARTGVEQIRLIAGGRVVKSLFEIEEKVLAVGTSLAEASRAATAVEDAAAERRRLREREVVDDLSEAGDEARDESDDEGCVFGRELYDEGAAGRTGFGRIEVLPDLPGSETASKLLERLGRDVGVRAVMRERGWFVPVLCEMYPDGKVGVDPVCVLGLNESHGQRIKLRLRTDDLRGFRKLLGLKKVLYHELAHNERSEHDAIFYGIVSDIDRDATKAAGAAATARRLGGAALLRPPTNRAAAGGRLGGVASLDRARAAQVGGFALACTCPDHQIDKLPEEYGVEESKGVEPPEPEEQPMDLDAEEEVEDEEEEDLGARDDPPVDPNSREGKLLEALRELGQVEPNARRDAADTLNTILANAPDAKYRRIRLANKRFLRTAGKFAPALRFLEAVGFQRERDGQEDVLIFRRHDPALLWLGRSALNDWYLAPREVAAQN